MKGARENLAEERRGPKKDEDEDERLEGGIVCPAGKRRRKSGAVLWTQEQSKAVISSASPIRARGRGTCSLQASSFLLTGLERQARTKAAEAIRLLGGKEMDKVPPPPTAIAHSRGSNSKVLRFQQDVVVVTPLIKDSKVQPNHVAIFCPLRQFLKILQSVLDSLATIVAKVSHSHSSSLCLSHCSVSSPGLPHIGLSFPVLFLAFCWATL